MTIRTSLQQIVSRYSSDIQQALQSAIASARLTTAIPAAAELEAFYGQISYHLGWVDAHFSPVQQNTGKLLRPTLLLLAYEAAGAWGLATTRTSSVHLHRALPAAVALELFHNFTLMHDDIEDGDVERRHRPTAWRLWGIPFAINTGDGLHCLSRLAFFKLLDEGVEAPLVAHLGKLFDRACLMVIEGQHIDLSFESHLEISVSMYQDMIIRKTAILLGCAAEMGALLGTDEQSIIEGLSRFGLALGIAFQVRDDLLGIWASYEALGKTPTGDISRRKKTLPILHAWQHASWQDRTLLRTIYQQKQPLSSSQISQILTILERTRSKEFCQQYLTEQCQRAYEAIMYLPHAPTPLAQQARADLEVFIHYLREDIP